MKNQVITLEKDGRKDLAEAYFMDMCGYNRSRKIPRKAIEKGKAALDDIYNKFSLRAVISEYPGSCLHGDKMTLDGVDFRCRDLSKIKDEDVESIYVYLMTAGQLEEQDASPLNQVYYDTWQSAYVQAGRIILQEYLAQIPENRDKYFSQSFGPGFYGMEVSQLKDFFKILKGNKIDIELMECGLMAPMKSFAGFYVVTEHMQPAAGGRRYNEFAGAS